MEKFARPGDFCPNPACPDYGKPQGKHQNNLKKFGKTRKGLQRRGHPDAPPPTFSDGWGGIGQAILEVYGLVPEYGGRRRPLTRKKPGRHWQYVQAIRQEDKQGRWMGIRIQVVLGSRREALEVLGRSTAYVERSHLTSRLFNGRQVRRTLTFSKVLEMYRAAVIWEDADYNLVRPHKSLRIPALEGSGQRWQPRTPAMAAGLTDHIWTVEEWLTTLPLPDSATLNRRTISWRRWNYGHPMANLYPVAPAGTGCALSCPLPSSGNSPGAAAIPSNMASALLFIRQT